MRWQIVASLLWLVCLVTASGLLSDPEHSGSKGHQNNTTRTEPRCGRDFGGLKCDDPKVGKFGMCCSRYGFCGRKPFHCVERLGCQSNCNNDLDRAADSNSTDTPTVVVPKKDTTTRVIIKHIQMAIPLCDSCAPKTAPAKKSKVAKPPHHRFTAAKAEPAHSPSLPRGLAIPEPEKSIDPDDPHVKDPTETQKYREAVQELQSLKTAAEKKAKQIISNAQKTAEDISGGKLKDAKNCANCMRTIVVADFKRPKRIGSIRLESDDEEDPSLNPLDPRGYL